MKFQKHEIVILSIIVGLGVSIYLIYLFFGPNTNKNKEIAPINTTPKKNKLSKQEILDYNIDLFEAAKKDITQSSFPLMLREKYQAKYYFDNQEVDVIKYNDLQKIRSTNVMAYVIDNKIDMNVVTTLFYDNTTNAWIKSMFTENQKGYEYFVINEAINKFIAMNSTTKTTITTTMPLKRFYAFLTNVIKINIQNPVYNETEVLTFKAVYNKLNLINFEIIFPRSVVIAENNAKVSSIKANFSYQDMDFIINPINVNN